MTTSTLCTRIDRAEVASIATTVEVELLHIGNDDKGKWRPDVQRDALRLAIALQRRIATLTSALLTADPAVQNAIRGAAHQSSNAIVDFLAIWMESDAYDLLAEGASDVINRCRDDAKTSSLR